MILMRAASEDQLMSDVLTRLVSQHPSCDPADIEHAVQRARECFAASPIRDFVPLLVERRVRDQLALD